MNSGPASLLERGLPPGFEKRVKTFRFGGLTVHAGGRRDQVFLKLYATVDQWGGAPTRHEADLRRLEPARDELLAAARWTRTHDPSEGFRGQLVAVLAAFGIGNADDVV